MRTYPKKRIPNVRQRILQNNILTLEREDITVTKKIRLIHSNQSIYELNEIRRIIQKYFSKRNQILEINKEIKKSY